MFGKKEPHGQITDGKELNEIAKIEDRLEDGEEVIEVAKQSKLAPGGSKLTPNTIFATDRRLIIRNPTMLGARQNIEFFDYDQITNIKLEKGVFSATLVLSYPGMDRTASMLSWGREDDGEIDAIPKDKAENILQIVRNAIVKAKKESQKPTQVVQQTSTADELAKLAKLHKDGILSDKEFDKMKKDLISKM
jgi:hypothetical protein